MIINSENYELYLFQYQEDMLSAEERGMVEAFLAQHPDLAQEMALYDKELKADPMTDVVYADKAGLKQIAARSARVVPLRPRRTLVASAACLALLMAGGLWWLQTNNNDNQAPMVAMIADHKPVANTPHTSSDPAMAILPQAPLHAEGQHLTAAQQEKLSEPDLIAHPNTAVTEPSPLEVPKETQTLLACNEGPATTEGRLIHFIETPATGGKLIAFQDNKTPTPTEWLIEATVSVMKSPMIAYVANTSKQIVEYGDRISQTLYNQSIIEIALTL